MDFPALVQGVLLRRYQRFLADVRLPSGELVTAHCPNTGAMTGCATPGATVWLAHSANPRRKLPYTWELIVVSGSVICIHSALANKVVAEAIGDPGLFPEFDGLTCRPEVSLADGSRLDFCLEGRDQRVYLEVKAVTYANAEGMGFFPDSISVRARKHIESLVNLLDDRTRAVLVFCVFNSMITRVAPARSIDPLYSDALLRAVDKGLEVLAIRCDLSPSGIYPTGRLPVILESTLVEKTQ